MNNTDSNMNVKICPDCNSLDLQKIEKKETVMKDDGGGGIGLLGSLFGFNIKSKVVAADTNTYFYFACRDCGREFQ